MDDADRARLKVLVIDDDEFMLGLLTAELREVGVRDVAGALNGDLALHLVDERGSDGFDVVVCDLKMPRMDGLEVLRHLADREFAGAVVLISGVDRRVLEAARELALARSLNVLGALAKPVSTRMLADLLGKLDLPPAVRLAPPDEEIVVGTAEWVLDDLVNLYFLPRVAVGTRQVSGVEVLARWRGRRTAGEGAGPYIDLGREHDVADRDDPVYALTEAVCRQMIGHAGAWQRAGRKLTLSLNVSIGDLARRDFPDFLVATANRNALDVDRVMLGLAVDQCHRNPTLALEVMSRLRLRGCRISLEGFALDGMSLGGLGALPFTALKLDRRLLREAASGGARQALDRELAIAGERELELFGDGIEDAQDWNLARELGCASVQGSYVGPPMPAEHFDAWLEERDTP